ncbi:MAG: hypothetical protein N3F64_05485 [Nitrososphaeria archaeon]|nr:hypothetical protein [Nitrososphaeria archaeon]
MKYNRSLKIKTILSLIILLLTIVPLAKAAPPNGETGPNTYFYAWYYNPPEVFSLESQSGRIIYGEIWGFAIRDLDPPVGKAGLSDFELFAVSHTIWGYDPEDGQFAEAIVFGTLKYSEDDGYFVPTDDSSYRVSGGGSFTVRPVSGPDFTDWEKVVFKLSAKDVRGSKVSISGTYVCASGPPTYYVSLTIMLTGQVYEYDYEEDAWVPTGRTETHTLKLRGYPQYYYYLPPYVISSWAYPNELVWFPWYWPLWD